VCLSNFGRREEALAASQEAVAIDRRLAETRPDVFLLDLAMSLGAQGQTYAQAGRHADAASAFHEGLTTITPFAERNVQAFGSLVGQLCLAYIAACTKAGTAPDAALLERVARAIGNDDEKTGG
jgi:tetratricopeptide (TPR) repeat protein